jgi:hypothetical protein
VLSLALLSGCSSVPRDPNELDSGPSNQVDASKQDASLREDVAGDEDATWRGDSGTGDGGASPDGVLGADVIIACDGAAPSICLGTCRWSIPGQTCSSDAHCRLDERCDGCTCRTIDNTGACNAEKPCATGHCVPLGNAGRFAIRDKRAAKPSSAARERSAAMASAKGSRRSASPAIGIRSLRIRLLSLAFRERRRRGLCAVSARGAGLRFARGRPLTSVARIASAIRSRMSACGSAGRNVVSRLDPGALPSVRSRPFSSGRIVPKNDSRAAAVGSPLRTRKRTFA